MTKKFTKIPSTVYPTDLELKKNYPEQWDKGYKQGLDKTIQVYKNPYPLDTWESVAFVRGTWAGFLKSEGK